MEIKKTQIFSRGRDKTVYKFRVVPNLPDELKFLETLAHNLWYVWDREGLNLLRQIDRDLWDQVGHNAVALLGSLSQEKLHDLASDESFLANMARVRRDFEDYMSGRSWFARNHSALQDFCVAYFSAEFGINECIRIYSGGLGMLAGDHLKSASDLGLPLVGVGLLYREGYFTQYLNADGWQQETYPDNDFVNMPVSPVTGKDGRTVAVSVRLLGREVFAEVWKANVGRINLYLLNANIERNAPQDREITAQLYGGDLDMRMKQEILLGIGGFRALLAIGINPTVVHINEGHAAFMALERIRLMMEGSGLTFHEAREAASPSQVFTTHTPVPAGNDEFSPDMIWGYFGDYATNALGLTREEFLGLGRKNPFNTRENFCMTVLALRLANHANGVSKLHGQVSRAMWKEIWPEVPEEEIPIEHITNGVHHSSWISPDMSTLLDRYLGPKWREQPDNQEVWNRVAEIPYSEIWRTHERRRERLVAHARIALHRQMLARKAPKSDQERAWEVLDPQALTIGFARRFATYKRATLLFRDVERLAKLVNSPDRPVQFIFAGKAHPRDIAGKELIKTIVSVASKPEFRRRIVFLENYDMNTARYLVQGVDVWLNTPRRPLEASGTSGMKVTFNGGLNFSVLDGWWDEGYKSGNGWAIGGEETYSSTEEQDTVESREIYRILEHDIVPVFYQRGEDRLPRRWIDMMRNSFRQLCPVYNTHRMVKEYTTKFYIPAFKLWKEFEPDNFKAGRDLAKWERNLYDNWHNVKVERVDFSSGGELKLGQELLVSAFISLGALSPEDVTVEVYHGMLDAEEKLRDSRAAEIPYSGDQKAGLSRFEGRISCKGSGHHGFAVRVVPNIRRMKKRFEPGLLTWG